MKKFSKTIIYYTSNRENEKFEEKIRQNLLDQTNLPIISVSQKPINFGDNICVGSVGSSYINEWRQILVGAKKAKTDYIVFAESDFLYPKEYFEFEPEGDNLYRYNNVWILFSNRSSYHRKKYSEGCQIGRREYIIEQFEKGLKGFPQWYDGASIEWPNKEQKNIFFRMPATFFGSDIPAISFKTGNGVRKNTNTLRGEESARHSLPYWGHINKLKQEYL